MKKPKLLFFLRLPPRLTGATLMNSFVHESQLLRQHFRIKTIRAPHAKTADSFGEKSFVKLLGIIKAQFQLFFTILFYRPRFVYMQMSPLGGAFLRDVLFVAVAKILNVRIVHHMHGKGIKQEQNKRYFKKLYRFVFRNETVICLAKSLTSDIEDVYKGTPYIVPNVIKKELDTVPERTFTQKLEILFISNLFVFKGIYVFIEILNQLKKQGIPFFARIVGSEAEVTANNLADQFKKYDLQPYEVEYLGPLYNEEKWNAYAQSTVLVFPTLNDIWGLIILEAMQSGIPVIASIDGAIPEIIIDGETGLLAKQGDVSDFVNKLIWISNNPDKTEQMGQRGREMFLNKYSYDNFEQRMLQVFNQVLKSIIYE